MRKLLQLGLFLLLGMMAAHAQSTVVTATITDTDAQTWNNGTVTASFLPGPVQNFNWPGGAIPSRVKANLDGTGTFTMSLPDNSTITPVGSLWNFSICPNASAPCVVKQIAVSGSTLNLSTQLSAVAIGPRFPAGSSSYGYLDIEIFPLPLQGGVYWNVTSKFQRIWTGTAWQNQGGGSGVISFNTRTGAVVPVTGDYTAAQVTNAADVTAANIFTNATAQQFNAGADFFGAGSYVNEGAWNFIGTTTELHYITTFDIFEAEGTATSSNNFGSMFGPRLQTNYWQGAAPAIGEASPFVTCAAGTNPLCTWSLHWIPDRTIPPVGTATLAESLPGPLTVPDFYDLALTVVNDCLLVGAGGHVTEGPCTAGGVNATSIQGTPVSATSPTNGYVLGFNGIDWLPVSPTVASGAVATTPGSGVTQTVTQQSGTTLAVNNLNNQYAASQYQTGGGNNGIANAVALNGGTGETVAVDPGYASTEVIPGLATGIYGGEVYSPIPSWPNWTHVTDQRVGLQNDVYTIGGSSLFTAPFMRSQFVFNTYQTTGTTTSNLGFVKQANFEGTGQQINGFGGVNLKTYYNLNVDNMVSTAQGQKLMELYNEDCGGVGDCINMTRYTEGGGGTNAYTDEGINDINSQVTEAKSMSTGTISSITGNTSMQVSLSSGQGKQGQARYVGDITAKTSCAYPTCYISVGDYIYPPAAQPGNSNGQVPPMATFVGTSFTPSTLMMGCTTAFGGTCPNTTLANPTGQLQSAAGGYAPGTLTIQLVTAAPILPYAYVTTTSALSTIFTANPTTTFCTVADSQYIEQAQVTAVPSSTTITMAFNKPHFNGFTISNCGSSTPQGIENTGATTTVGGIAYQQVWPVVGALDSTHLLIWDHNSQQGYSQALTGNNTQGVCQTDNINNISAVGTTVTMTDSTNPATALFQNASNVVISTANSTYNGTVSTVAIAGYFNGLANYPALTYTLGTAPSGTVPTTGTMTLCNSGFNLYPIMETADVLNPSTHAVDGYFKATAGSSLSAFTVGDTIKQFHWPAMYVSEGGYNIYQEMPLPPYSSFPFGTYINLGDDFAGGYSGFSINNLTATNKYQGYGGTLNTGGVGVRIGGPGIIGTDFSIPQAPDFAIISNPNCKAAPIGCSNPGLSPFMIYNGAGSQEGIWDNTAFDSIDFSGGIRLKHGSFSGAIYMPSAGNFALSADQSASPTPDANLAAASFNGVPLTAAGSATSYLNAAGGYSIPAGSGFTPGGDLGGTSTVQTVLGLTHVTNAAIPVAVTAPSLATTGTTPQIRSGLSTNTDLAGQLTLVAGTKSYSFANGYGTAPICVATDTTAANAVKVTTTTTTLTITGTSTDVINYICIGRT